MNVDRDKSDFKWAGTGRHNYWRGSKEKVVISLSIPSLFPEFALVSFLPLFCHLIWKGGSSYYCIKRFDSSSDGVTYSWSKLTRHTKASLTGDWFPLSMARYFLVFWLINECYLFRLNGGIWILPPFCLFLYIFIFRVTSWAVDRGQRRFLGWNYLSLPLSLSFILFVSLNLLWFLVRL